MVLDGVIAFLLGVAGGVIRIAFSWTWVWPHKLSNDDGRPGFVLGSLGTLATAGASGFLLWALVTNELFADKGFGIKTIAATILVGLGGGEALMAFLDKLLGVTTGQQANQQVNHETSAIAKPLAEAQKTLTQDVSDLRKQVQELQHDKQELQDKNRELQEELGRLKKNDT
jgi:hypothetical protein